MVILTDENFKKEVLEANLPVLVDFWAPWCGPCQTAGPVIEELAKEYEGKIKVGKINIDENQKISEKYGILSIPTVIIFKNGEEVKRQVGFVVKEGYINLISNI